MGVGRWGERGEEGEGFVLCFGLSKIRSMNNRILFDLYFLRFLALILTCIYLLENK